MASACGACQKGTFLTSVSFLHHDRGAIVDAGGLMPFACSDGPDGTRIVPRFTPRSA